MAPLCIDVLTLFPRMVAQPLSESILGKAQEKGLLRVQAWDVREHGIGKHRVTDDVPYGGGAGMVMKPEPLSLAIEAARARAESESRGPARVIAMSPQGARFDQRCAERLARMPSLVFVCGRYEGIDERVSPLFDEELSLGDFILTGGEFAALAIIDAVARLLPGVLGNDESAATESSSAAPGAGGSLGSILLEAPHYTRPPEFRGARVPEILLSGDHAKIARWRRQQQLVRTRARRPDLLEKAALTAADRALLNAAVEEAAQGTSAPE